MKIIEAMKRIKELNIKCDDLKRKVAENSADLDFQTPVYADTRAQIREWIQSFEDSLKEIARLRVAIQRTNMATSVVVDFDGKQVTKTIAEWIHRRRDLAASQLSVWASLTDRGLKEGQMQVPNGQPVTVVKIRRYFDPLERDSKIMQYKTEPSKIDGTLEVVNAVTDLME